MPETVNRKGLQVTKSLEGYTTPSASLAMVLIAVGDRRPLAKVLIAVAALASVSMTYYYHSL
jgi:hypothetical protein